MRLPAPPAWVERLARPFDPAFDRGGPAIVGLLVLFVAAWTLFHMVSNAPLDVHGDLGEIFTWSRHPMPGYYKHPPLGALMGMLWFAVFPATDWSFQLLAMTNAALALFCVDLIARRYLPADKRLFVLLLLLTAPFYQFLSERFASNQTLLLAWPLATYCFLRAYETRGIGWSLAAGATAALAMLGKYYSLYLVGSLVLAALLHPARAQYLKSASPWLSVAAGLAVLGPHLHWLVDTGFLPFGYAFDVHGGLTAGAMVWRTANYLVSGCAYMLVPVAIYLVVVRPDRATLREALWPADPDRRMLVHLLAGFILLPALSVPFFGVGLTSLWTMQAWFLLPIILLAPANAVLPRPRARLVALGVAIFTLGALALSPVVAGYYHASGRLERAYYREVASALAERWKSASDRPFGIALGSWELSAALTFYLPGHPDSAPHTAWTAFPWITEQRLRDEGWMAACPLSDADCVAAERDRAASDPRARLEEITITRTLLGIPGTPRRFLLAVAPPSGAPPATR